MKVIARVKRLDRRHKWEEYRVQERFERSWRESWHKCSACGKRARIVVTGVGYLGYLTRKHFAPVLKKALYGETPVLDMLLRRAV